MRRISFPSFVIFFSPCVIYQLDIVVNLEIPNNPLKTMEKQKYYNHPRLVFQHYRNCAGAGLLQSIDIPRNNMDSSFSLHTLPTTRTKNRAHRQGTSITLYDQMPFGCTNPSLAFETEHPPSPSFWPHKHLYNLQTITIYAFSYNKLKQLPSFELKLK